MKIDLEVDISQTVDVQVCVTSVISALHDSPPTTQWNCIARIFNDFIPEASSLEPEKYEIAQKYVEKLAKQFELKGGTQ